jgi:acyl-CoA thioester hydrolase
VIDSNHAPAAEKRFEVHVTDRVYWSDVDKMGVMYFGRYVRFAERAETQFFRAAGYSYDGIHAEFGIWLARIRLEIDYRLPARLDDELVCRAQLEKLGASSLRFRFPVERRHDARRVADIGLTIACLDAGSLKSTRIPPSLREGLSHCVCRAPAGRSTG